MHYNCIMPDHNLVTSGVRVLFTASPIGKILEKWGGRDLENCMCQVPIWYSLQEFILISWSWGLKSHKPDKTLGTSPLIPVWRSCLASLGIPIIKMRPSYLYIGNSYIGKMISAFWWKELMFPDQLAQFHRDHVCWCCCPRYANSCMIQQGHVISWLIFSTES